jgi:hypothetical protein
MRIVEQASWEQWDGSPLPDKTAGRIRHRTLEKTTPAVATGLADHTWSRYT